jgi:hypothetical protein
MKPRALSGHVVLAPAMLLILAIVGGLVDGRTRGKAMNATLDNSFKLGGFLGVSLQGVEEGMAVLYVTGGDKFPIYEPVTIGPDFIRFSLGKQPSASMTTVLFHAIVRIQH